MKTCVKCRKEKELNLFYRDIRHRDGLSSYCKDCHNDIVKITHQKKPEKYKEYRRIYQKTHKSSYQLKNPNAIKANLKVREAVRNGVLKRLPCEECGNEKVCAHHPFYRYSEPLKVIWLCAKHHKFVHTKEKAITNPISLAKIEYKNQQLQRVSENIDFYLNYHKVPEPAKTMIKGNLMQVFKKELKIF